MKNKFKKLITLVLSCLMLFSVGLSAGCGGGTSSSSDQTLEIFLLYKGYQDEWLTSLIDMFKKEEWVTNKYPELKVDYAKSGVDSVPFSKLSGGLSLNTYDLMFGVNLNGLDSTGYLADLTDIVYLTDVPDQAGTKIIDKVPTDVLSAVSSSIESNRTDGNDTYYSVSYIRGMFGMMYNADHLTSMGVSVPLTTLQFKQICQKAITDGYNYQLPTGQQTSNVAIMNASEDNYWVDSFKNWWAQYEGYDEYENFYGGWWGDERSNKVLTQLGRLRALEEFDSIFQSGYGYESAAAVDYKFAQSNFLGGNGLFHYNGDYFASEMSMNIETYKKNGIDFNIRFMKMPVLSAIVEKLELYTSDKEYSALTDNEKSAYDQKLAMIIKDVDDNKLYDQSVSKENGISKFDFDKVAEARCMAGYTSASAQTAVIPSYSPAKELAADFLRFMYTEKAIKQFSVASKGVLFPANSTVAYEKEVYDTYSTIQQSKIDIMNGSSNYAYTILPSAASFSLGKAGLDALASLSTSVILEEVFSAKGNDRISAREIYDGEINHWNETVWNDMLSRAGLAGQ